jgi:hypothetical protein
MYSKWYLSCGRVDLRSQDMHVKYLISLICRLVASAPARTDNNKEATFLTNLLALGKSARLGPSDLRGWPRRPGPAPPMYEIGSSSTGDLGFTLSPCRH